MKPARVSIPTWTAGSAVAGLIFAVCLAGSIASRAYFPACVFAVFCALATLLLLAYGPVEVSEAEVVMHTPLGTRAIRWDRIERIQMGQSHLVLEGQAVCLVLPQPRFWNGKEKKQVTEAFDRFSQTSGIMPHPSWSADYRFSKNAKRAHPTAIRP